MIRHLLLDLDNTLYPATGKMDAGITRRMLAFVADYLGVSLEQAAALRGDNLPRYGTTFEWLKSEKGLTDEQLYFRAVHPESEIEELTADPRLRDYLLSLKLPMTLLTNSPLFHAERLLKFFGIEDLFLGIFDLTFHKGRGKPHADCFLSTLKAVGKTVEESLFVDDHPKYVKGYKAIGGQSAIVDATGKNRELAKAEGYWYLTSIYDLDSVLAANS